MHKSIERIIANGGARRARIPVTVTETPASSLMPGYTAQQKRLAALYRDMNVIEARDGHDAGQAFESEHIAPAQAELDRIANRIMAGNVTDIMDLAAKARVVAKEGSEGLLREYAAKVLLEDAEAILCGPSPASPTSAQSLRTRIAKFCELTGAPPIELELDEGGIRAARSCAASGGSGVRLIICSEWFGGAGFMRQMVFATENAGGFLVELNAYDGPPENLDLGTVSAFQVANEEEALSVLSWFAFVWETQYQAFNSMDRIKLERMPTQGTA